MSIDIIFKIAAVGVLATLISQLLTRWGRDDIAVVTTVAGLIIVLLMALDMVSDFFSAIKSVFELY